MTRSGYRQVSAIAAAIAFAAAMPGAALASTYKTFGKWDVYCTNGLNCDMLYYSQDGKGMASFTLHRSSAPQAPVSIIFTLADKATLPDPKTARVSAQIDGKEIALPAGDLTFDETRQNWVLKGDILATGLIDAMRAGQTMRFSIGQAPDMLSIDLPLSGSSASFLFFDDVQGRVDHVDALQAKGAKPPVDALPVSDLTSLAELPDTIRPVFEENGQCGGFSEGMMADMGAFVRHFSPTEALYAVPCGGPGAYNVPMVIYYQTEDYTQQLQFPVMMGEGPGVTSDGYNLDFDLATDTITSFFKGRGLGDCGSWYRWKVTDGGAGKTLVLLRETDKNDCDGNYAGGPEKWPAAWPKR
jgi:invasion protein IalB